MSLLKAAATSSVVMLTGDVICQVIQARKPPAEAIRTVDTTRAGRFGFIGLTLHGPFFLKGFQWIDHVFGARKSLSVAIKKTTFGQVTIFPVYLATFFMYTSILEGRTFRQAVEKTREKIVPTFAVGTVFWPLANIINFKYISAQQRVLYVGLAGIMWNAFLSWENELKLSKE